MTREAILAEIRALQRQKEINPEQTHVIDAQLGAPRGFGPAASLGLIDGDHLIAAVVFNNWSPEDGTIEMSAAADSRRWLTRPLINAMFGFCFVECGCQLVALRVSERNATMIDIARRFGFDETRIARLRGRDEAEIIFTMTDDAWNMHPAKKGNP